MTAVPPLSNHRDTGRCPVSNRRQRKQAGFVLITMAAAAFVLMGILGLSVDIGRTFISKNETQAFSDAAALKAAHTLDGTTTGLNRARTQFATALNTWNFNTTSVSSPTLEFSTSSAGPWVSNPGTATSYGFTRVRASAPVSLFFLPAVVSRTTQTVTSSSVAGQVVTTRVPRGLAPYSAIATSSVGPYFGLSVGQSYTIQWPNFNSSRAGCPANPSRCFVMDPCPGDTVAAQTKVVTNWAASSSGYWGSSDNSTLREQIVNNVQTMPIEVGLNIDPVLTNGNKAAQAVALDNRASQDVNTTNNVYSDYLASNHNGRRVIGVPVVDPRTPDNTTVVGYGAFLLYANGPGASNYYTRNTTGNEGFCAIYLGSYNIGGAGPAGGVTPTGVTWVKLVE